MAKTQKKPSTSAIQRIYEKYEYIVKPFVDSIYNFERFGYEKEDITQEFKIKIYTSIIAYAEKWAEFKRTGKYKPVPIEGYLRACMVNKKKDFIKLFNMERVESVDKISIETDGFDYSVDSGITSVMSLNDNICEINGVDLFQGLIGRKKKIFSDYLSGVTIKELSVEYPMIDVDNVVNKQIEFLKQYKTQLFDFSRVEYTMTEAFED